MYLPKTLSSDVVAYLECNHFSSDRIVSKLEINPSILMKFLMQASQNRVWFHSNVPLVLRLVNVVTRMIVNQLVSWDLVLKVLSMMIRNNPVIHQSIMKEGLQRKSCCRLYVSLIFAANCPSERDMWSENTKKNLNQVVVSHIEAKNFVLIYKSLFSDDFSNFYTVQFKDLLQTLFRCKAFGYEKGVNALESIAISRLNNFKKVLKALTFATLNQFERLREQALFFINNFQFHVVRDEIKTIYNVFSIKTCYNNEKNNECSSTLVDSFQAYAEYKRRNLIQDIAFEVFQLIVEGDDVTSSCKTLKNVFSKAHEKGPLIFKETPRDLIIDSEDGLIDEEIIALMIAYKFTGLELTNYSLITFDFLEKISKIQPDLDYLGHFWCDEVEEKLINAIPTLFPHLGKLSLSDISICVSAAADILKLSELDTLELRNCTLSLPKEISSLPKLEALVLFDVKIVEGSLLALLKAADKLSVLRVAKCIDFDLTLYPNAENLRDLAISSSQLKVKEGGIDGFHRYQNLNQLSIEGSISPELKQALAEVIKSRKISIKFSGSN